MSETFFCATCSKYRDNALIGIRKPGRGPVCKLCIENIGKHKTKKQKVRKPQKTAPMTRMPIPE